MFRAELDELLLELDEGHRDELLLEHGGEEGAPTHGSFTGTQVGGDAGQGGYGG